MSTTARHAPPPGPARAALTALGRLVWPVDCPGCEREDVALCPTCRWSLAAPPLGRVEHTAPGAPPVRAAARYDGAPRRLLLAWKERGRHDLSPVLADALRRAGEGAVLAAVRDGDGAETLALVPVPSTRAAVRARGDDLVADLARRWARSLRHRGVRVRVEPVLALRAGAGDQVGRTATERAAARRGALHLRGRPPARCLLVDDVVTTGSTLAEAARVLSGVGTRVLGGAVVLAAPPPGTARRGGSGPGPDLSRHLRRRLVTDRHEPRSAAARRPSAREVLRRAETVCGSGPAAPGHAP
ncbi:ComF family protein [uncultured Pseudokineococcus sp.]|uniref:ComF family protein n=1 Tax=uncultured Pseudokineococcus sp. TaxID=1642928 RepID=UPI002623544C|nr:phosphoribosyltransferase family protein [uncultured Pseudokineococcus sp.]